MVGKREEEKKAPDPYPTTNAMSHPSISEPSLKSAAQKIGWFTASCVLVSNIIGGWYFHDDRIHGA